MKARYFISFTIVNFTIISSVIFISNVLAQAGAGANIQYPVAELGNCSDESACRMYCDNPENANICLDFAERNNLMSKQEIKIAKNFVATGSKGPGNCNGKKECETFCNDIAHIDECIAFAENNNLIPSQELEEAKKVQATIKRGVKPPPCGNKKQCDIYCNESEHMEECISFGAEAGFIQGKELEDAQKMLSALRRGIKPLPCRGRNECDEYCSNPDNMEKCMTFAMEAGFMSDKEKEDSQKILQAIRKGVKPPACKGKEECDVYCNEESHFEECMNFAEAAGFMTAEDAAMARKTGGKGPGDCKGKEECEAFCNNPDNQETCFNFGKEYGLIPEEDLRQMEEGKQRFQESLSQAPPVVLDCLNEQFGTEMMEKFKGGGAMPPREIGDKMRECFKREMGSTRPNGQGGPGEGGIISPEDQTGPGGCVNPEECKAYCKSNPEECQRFQPGPGEINPGGQIMPQQAGPGWCNGPDECAVYCESNPDDCKNFIPAENGQFAPGTGPSNFEEQEIQNMPIKPEGYEVQPGMQNRLIPQRECQGEYCPQQFSPAQPGESSLPGEYIPYLPDGQIQPEFIQQPSVQQPPVNLQPPVNQQQLPANNITPPSPSEIPLPTFENPTPPTAVNRLKLLLGALLKLFGD